MLILHWLTILLTLVPSIVLAEVFYPSNLLLLDEKFTHHVILVEKSTHTLFVYENNKGEPRLVKEFKIATGKLKGNKEAQGDHRTPEGIYVIQSFLAEAELLKKYGEQGKMYGSGAFPLNYPNEIDERLGKTGNGIWIHSTDDDNRISKGLDSKGCVVLANNDLKELSNYIDLKSTPVVIVQDLHFLSQKSWKTNRDEILTSLNKWMDAWRGKDFKNYIESYHEDDFFDKSKGSFKNYKNYKQAVFSRPDKPNINFLYPSIIISNQYAVVQLQQDYRSNIINDVGHKTLYLKKNAHYDWKIVTELWEKDLSKDVTFTPEPRFFKIKGN